MIHTGDCIAVMATLPSDSVDAVVTDPPYGLEFMGKGWDRFGAKFRSPSTTDKEYYETGVRLPRGSMPDAYQAGTPFQAWCTEWGREALRVTKPGGYLLAFGGTRTHHRLVCGLEDAGWIIRDELTWVYACLSDDTEVLTHEGWVPYNRVAYGDHAAAFDTTTGELRWERVEGVYQYDHEGYMVEVGPSLVTGNHRVVLSPESQVPLPSDAELRGLWDRLPDVGPLPGRTSEGLFEPVHVGPTVSVTTGQYEAARGTQGPDGDVRDVRRGVLATYRVATSEQGNLLLQAVQREATDPESPVPSGSNVERRAQSESRRADAGSEELGLEGRRYGIQEARELLWSALRAGSRVGADDGSQGRLRDGAPATDGSARGLPADQDGSGEPREPRSDRQSSRESEPVAGQPDPQAVRVGQGARGDRLPSGDTPRLVDYAGVVWCITVPSGAFVARRGGVAFVTGNSGFPKGKANLKPAHEPIVLARKPGPLRPLAIDACRIGPPGDKIEGGTKGTTPIHGGGITNRAPVDQSTGRWPSNLLLSDSALFDEPNPYVVGSGAVQASPGNYERGVGVGNNIYGVGMGNRDAGDEQIGFGDSGGYSRFFLIPKSSRDDREPVLKGQLTKRAMHPMEEQTISTASNRRCRTCGRVKFGQPHCECENPIWQETVQRENSHPTVKPVDLMRHLVRLVTPPGGTVLDCFAGSGSTLIACEMEGFPWIGIEKEPEYVAIAEARLNGVQRGLGLDVPAPTSSYRPPSEAKMPGWKNKPEDLPKGWNGGWATDPPEEAA